MAADQKKSLYRVQDGLVGGVCAGLAEHFDVDIIVPRILAVLIVLVTFGLGAFAYLILWMKLPERASSVSSDPFEIQPDLAGPDASSAAATGIALSVGGHSGGRQRSTTSLVARVAAAVGLAVLFLVVAAMVPPIMPGTQWWELWPVAVLVFGVFLVIVPMRSENEMAWHVIGIVVTAFAAMALPMSLDIVSWYSVPSAFRALWFLVAAGGVMLIVGIVKNDMALMVGGAVCLVVFCLFTLLFLSVPGSERTLVFVSPQYEFRIIPL